MTQFWLTLLLLTCLFTVFPTSYADPLIPVYGSQASGQNSGNTGGQNLCDGGCYSTPDGSAKGYFCSRSISEFLISNSIECSKSNCARCNTADQCLICFDEYYPGNTGDCYWSGIILCPVGCSACDTDGNCVLCQGGYALDISSCEQVCPQGKFYHQGGSMGDPCGGADKCADCPENCLECSDANTCTACDSGFDPIAGVCAPLPCSPHFYRVDAQNCADCSENCFQCSDADICTACDMGFDLVGGVCVVPCSPHYYHTNAQNCASCPLECTTCTTQTTCSACADSYYLSAQSCLNCPPECKICSSLASCSACADAFYLDTQSCYACPTGCTACSGPTTCTACDSSHIFDPQSSACNLLQNPPTTPTTKPTPMAPIKSNTATVTAKSKILATAITQITNVLSSGKSIAMSASICGKILTNIRYLNITYSSKLQTLFNTWTTSLISLGFDFDMPNSIESKMPERHVPFVFKRYGIPSNFLENFWNNISVLSGVFLIFVSLRIVEYVHEKSVQTERSSLKAMIKTCRLYIQNFFVTLLYGIYGDALLFSIIEYQSIKFEWNLALLSFATSIFFLLLAVLSFMFHLRLLLKYQSLKKSTAQSFSLERFIQDTKGTEVLYKDYHDTSIWKQSFLPFLIIRDLGFSLILASLYNFLLLQILLIFTLNVAMLLYVLICKPFKDRLDLIQQVFFEVAGLAVNVSVLVNSQLSDPYERMLNARENIGDAIILTNMVFNFVTAGFMAFKLILLLKDLYHASKQKNTKKRHMQPFDSLPTSLVLSPEKNTSVHHLNNNSLYSQEDSMSFQESTLPDKLPLNKHSHLILQNPQVRLNNRLKSNPRRPLRNSTRPFGGSEISQVNTQQEITINSPIPRKERQFRVNLTHLKRNRISALHKKQKMNGRINIDQRENFD